MLKYKKRMQEYKDFFIANLRVSKLDHFFVSLCRIHLELDNIEKKAVYDNLHKSKAWYLKTY